MDEHATYNREAGRFESSGPDHMQLVLDGIEDRPYKPAHIVRLYGAVPKIHKKVEVFIMRL